MSQTNKRLEFYDTDCFNRVKMPRGQPMESQGEGTDAYVTVILFVAGRPALIECRGSR